MIYTEYGLCIGLDELKTLVERVENESKYHNMESCIYIKGGDKPEIKQYCCYAECDPNNYTLGVKDIRKKRGGDENDG